METREALRLRVDVPDDDIEDIIGIAQELQDADLAKVAGATVADVQAVAAELEIEPVYVEKAIEVLGTRRSEHTERQQQQRAQWFGVAAVVLVLALVGGLGFGALTALSASQDAAAVEQLERAKASLDVVLQRQAALAPQLVAIAGGDSAGLDALARDVTDGETIEARLKASDALALELAKRLGSLPPATDDATAQQRLSLQHEITGTQNRITVERRRYEEARLTAQ